jgi:hypothetical protein
LLYPTHLLPEHQAEIRKDDAGVVWLGKDKSMPAVQRESENVS